MDPLSVRLNSLRGNALTADTAASAFRRVKMALETELSLLNEAVWSMQIKPERYSELRAEYWRLKDDLRIVESLLNLQLGIKEPQRKEPRRDIISTYGEL